MTFIVVFSSLGIFVLVGCFVPVQLGLRIIRERHIVQEYVLFAWVHCVEARLNVLIGDRISLVNIVAWDGFAGNCVESQCISIWLWMR